jgi:exosortase A-associated hydrolase 2
MVALAQITVAREEPLYFTSAPRRLYGVLHRPDNAVRMPFVFCHPFGEEKLWTHRVLVSFARALAAEGHPVLRFDCGGNGDSEGEFSASSLRTCVADTHAAVEHLKQSVQGSTVALLGLRLGASIASLVAEARDDVRQLVMWAPVTKGTPYAQELLRVNLTTQMAVYREIRVDRTELAETLRAGGTVNVEGYELGPAMWEDLNGLDLAAVPKRFEGACLIVQVERAPNAAPSAELQKVRLCYSRAVLGVVQEEPFWKEIQRFYGTAPNLFATTLEWLKNS